MGHRSKKKKKRSGSSAGGRRTSSSKDDNSFSAENAELITDELTALCAIFQEDCQVVPGSPRQVEIKLRPYSKDTGYENSDVSAILSVRFIPGYPNKCPKLQIVPEKGLSEIDTENLLALLHDQANINSREGRVMIYNLVEAAQEFLSEIVPQISLQGTDCSTQLSREDRTMSYRINYPSRGPFVYAYLNLFSGSGESWHWNLTMEQNMTISSSTHSDFLEDIKCGHQNIDKRAESELQPVAVKEGKQDFSNKPPLKLITVEEETEDEIKSTDSIKTPSYESFGDGSTMEVKDTFAQNHLEDTDDDYLDSDPSESVSSKSLAHNKSSKATKMELLLVHLLRLLCGPNGPLGDILPQITSELFDMECVTEHVKDLASKPSSTFNKTFSHVFGHHIVTSKFPRFWATSDAAVSRHLNDFVELQPLGCGGYGQVVLCKNKLDGRQYALKKIRLKEKSLPDRILREVTTLSLLQHQHVVRYYQAWFEKGIVDHYGDAGWESRTAASGSRTAAGSSFSFEEGSLSYLHGHENKSEYLYIQMEYCPRTLRQLFEAYDHFDNEFAWHLFRQIVEGLAHIHGQGIIHRDLTPNNIFFDARNDVKIGDFGLAKFLKREQLEQDIDASEAIGVSIDGTGQVGTYFYTAPEIEQGWPKIDEKADMYSLGVVFFELWHPFQTAMERHVVLSDLKQKGELPSDWVAEFPEQASLLRRLMSPSPSDRPSANELLKHAFPPRMEYELLDNVLRLIHTSEDTIVHDKIVNTIFDEDMLAMKYRAYGAGRSKLDGDDTSSAPLIGVNTRNRDNLLEFATGVFRQHCAKHVEIIPMRMLGECRLANRNSVKSLTQGGDIVELCHDLRVPFANWVTAKQIVFFKRYEISYVYRRAIGHSPPNRYLQGDFDIVGGATPLTEAETIKVTIDIISSFFHSEFCDIHLNHGDLLEAIWTWTGIRPEHRQKVAELLSLLGSLRPQTPERKSKWVLIRRQLQQELNLPEASVNRLQTVGLRFCGQIDQALPRLRGALPADRSACKALDELSELFNYLRVWKIDRHVYVDPLMPPTEDYHRNIFFQVYLSKNSGCLMEGTLLAIGGRYDHLLHSLEDFDHKSNLPGAVGSSLALETILLQHTYVDTKLYRYNVGIDILVCSRGGGGLLKERMELVAELWEKNINAEIVLTCDPSLKEQYEYANENEIKCLVIITDASVSQTDSVKVRHIEMKKEKSVERESLVKFLIDAMETQFKNPSIWN